MWKITYNLLIAIALPFFLLFALFHKKIRKNLLERLLPPSVNKTSNRPVWIHAASIGEGIIAETLIRYMEQHSPFHHFVLTTNTYYTKELLASKVGSDKIQVYSMPLDLPFSLRRFLRNRSFSALLIVETEIWPNLIWESAKRGIPIAIVNGRISDSTIHNYRRLSFFLKDILDSVSIVLAQSEEQAERFLSMGMKREKVINVGNIKYYRAIDQVSDVDYGEPAVTFGSIKEKEIDILIPVFKRLLESFPDLLLYVVPRELRLVGRLLQEIGRFTTTERFSLSRQLPEKPCRVVVVDTVGELLGIYGRSRVAFVGGSLAPYGGQNILEPLFFKTPVLFGPSTENFRDIALEIEQKGAGIKVQNGEALYDAICLLLNDKDLCGKMGNKGRAIIERQNQVMKTTVDSIERLIEKGATKG